MAWWKVLLVDTSIGLIIGVIICIVVAASVTAAGGPSAVFRKLYGLISGLAAAIGMLRGLFRILDHVLDPPPEPKTPAEVGRGAPTAVELTPEMLVMQIKRTMIEMARVRILDNIVPTRDMMTRTYDSITQPLWNSARMCFVTMGVIAGQKWTISSMSEAHRLIGAVTLSPSRTEVWVPAGKGIKLLELTTPSEGGNAYVKPFSGTETENETTKLG